MTLQVVYSVSAGVTSDISTRVFMASERLGLPPFTLSQKAEEGSVAHSTLVVDDSSGDLVLNGHRRIYFVETAAPTGQQVIGNAYVGKKTVSRGDWVVGPLARSYSVALADANTLISRRIVVGSDGSRPAETDVQRVQWLMTTTEANEFNASTTYINTDSPVDMDAVDYRGQSVENILNDCSQASGKNYWVIYEESLGEFSLWYDFDYSTAYSSLIRLSNDEADIDDTTTFAYFPTATLTQDPDRVYSGTYLPFDGPPRAVYEQLTNTGNQFVFRDVSYPSFNVKSETKARARAVRYNSDSDSEADVVSLSFVVPAGNVNSLMHGHRIEVEGTHWGFEGGNDYTEFTPMRALNRTVTQIGPNHYRIDAELTPIPTQTIPCAEFTATWDLPLTPSGFYTPLGEIGAGTGFIPTYTNDPDIIYYKQGTPTGILAYPLPSDHYGDNWAFPLFEQAWVGSPAGFYDTGWAQANNDVFMYVVGSGNMTLYTADHAGDPTFSLTLFHGADESESFGDLPSTDLGTFNGGDTPVVTIPDDGHCTHCVVLIMHGIANVDFTGFGGFTWAGTDA